MNVRCPHCHSQTELAPDSSIDCPLCGSQFNLAADAATATFRSQVRTVGHFQLIESLGSGNFGAGLRLYKSDWENPFPDVMTTRLEYRSANADPARF
jgi:hypothetical protein